MTWGYYADGLVKERKDRGGQLSTYAYDANNNLTSAKDASGIVSDKARAVDVAAAYEPRQPPRQRPENFFEKCAYCA